MIEDAGEELQLLVGGELTRRIRLLRRDRPEACEADGGQRDAERTAGLQMTPK
jgi:uncharacterized small protein (DUF1192 family)